MAIKGTYWLAIGIVGVSIVFIAGMISGHLYEIKRIPCAHCSIQNARMFSTYQDSISTQNRTSTTLGPKVHLYHDNMESRSLDYAVSTVQNGGMNKLIPFGIIGILSAQGNTHLRETSRLTWIKSIQGDILIKFLLDRPSPDTIHEESKYGDIIFLNSSTFGRARKFGEKLAFWLKYAYQQWPSVVFVAKMDDDVFLCPGIVSYLRLKVHPKVYMGWKHSQTASALWEGQITRNERMDEMFVVLGSQLVGRIALRQYCEPGQPCARGLIDTNYGGTSLGAWLESYNDITSIPMNNNVFHSRASYGGLTCNDRYLFHKVSSSQMKALYMAKH